MSTRVNARVIRNCLIGVIASFHCLFGSLPHWPINAAAPLAAQVQLSEVPLTPGLVINSSVRIKPGRYRLAGVAGSSAIVVRGSNIVVDLSGVTLEGGDPYADPDGYVGTGIEIDGGDHVTIKGGAIRGYKVAILARKSPFLHLTGLDLSYNWKQPLWSGLEKESLLDWMSYHDNA